MSSPVPPRRVPTLTEVVAWPPLGHAPSAEARKAREAREATPSSAADRASLEAASAAAAVSDELLVQRVLAGVQRQIDLVLEYRLRETLTPLLARAADGIVREARTELSASLRDVVERAVAQELARHRTR